MRKCRDYPESESELSGDKVGDELYEMEIPADLGFCKHLKCLEVCCEGFCSCIWAQLERLVIDY